MNDNRFPEPFYSFLKNEKGIVTPNRVQSTIIPKISNGKNLLFSAYTGSGKTLAYVIPFLQRYTKIEVRSHDPKALFLAPTKELAHQIYDVVHPLARLVQLKTVLLIGGNDRAKEKASLRKGSDIIIATPYRLSQHIASRDIDLRHIKYVVIDEADMLLDQGFAQDIAALLMIPSDKAQKVFVSATLDMQTRKSIKAIVKQVENIRIDTPKEIPSRIIQYLYPVVKSKKDALCVELLERHRLQKAIVFARKRDEIKRLAQSFERLGIDFALLHAERSHKERFKALRRFKEKKCGVLLASDVAARGLDFTDVEGVIHYDIPHNKNDYIHRCGRTGRGDKAGICILLVTGEEIEQLYDMQGKLHADFKEVILDAYAPKVAKARGSVLPSKRVVRKGVSWRNNRRSSVMRKGKKRKTTKRDGWKNDN